MHRHDDHDSPFSDPASPLVRQGEITVLRVSDINDIGVFLDQGTAKELLLPHNELHAPVRVGDEVVVRVLQDAHCRPYATNQITRQLDFEPWELRPGMAVTALVYGLHERGFLCVVNGRHAGMLYRDRTHRPIHVTDQLDAFIADIHPSGKLDLSLVAPGVDPFADDLARLQAKLRADGFVPVHDKSPAGEIRAQLGMSKKAFKRAVGALYRRHQVTLEPGGVRWITD